MRSTHDSHQSFYFYLGLAAFGVLCFLSILFWKERMLFLDNAFQSFLLLKDGSIEVMVYRWPAALMRVLPWLALKSGFGLSFALILFSCSYAFFQLAIFVLLFKGLKSPFFALLHLLICTLPILDSFYWCSSEYVQGLSVLLIFFAYGIRKKFQFNLQSGIIIAFIGLCLMFYHPLIILPFALMGIYFLFVKQSNWKMQLGRVMILFILIYVLKSFFFKNWYDDGKQAEFFQHFDIYATQLLSIPAHKVWISDLMGRHILWTVLFLITIIGLVYKKEYRHLFFLVASTLFYLMIVHIADPYVKYPFYSEVNYIALVLFSGLPFLTHLLNPLRNHRVMKLFLIGIVLTSLIRIGLRHSDFKARYTWIENQLTQSTHAKIYKLEKDVPMDILKMTWATPYESLLLSRLFNPELKTITIHRNIDLLDAYPNNKDLLLTAFKAIPLDTLPSEFNELKGKAYFLDQK